MCAKQKIYEKREFQRQNREDLQEIARKVREIRENQEFHQLELFQNTELPESRDITVT